MNFFDRQIQDVSRIRLLSPSSSAAGLGVAARLSYRLVLSAVLIMLLGCSFSKNQKPDQFFTSGSSAADMRGKQDMGKAEGTGVPSSNGKAASKEEAKHTLYERLGGEQGIAMIVDDFTVRVLHDPRVNWDRQNVQAGGLFSHHAASNWRPTPETIAILKKHLAQFLALTCGGPSEYEGRAIKAVHQDMKITTPEFNAAVGDLKASLDKLRIADIEQQDLLAIVESTRPQIVEEK